MKSEQRPFFFQTRRSLSQKDEISKHLLKFFFSFILNLERWIIKNKTNMLKGMFFFLRNKNPWTNTHKSNVRRKGKENCSMLLYGFYCYPKDAASSVTNSVKISSHLGQVSHCSKSCLKLHKRWNDCHRILCKLTHPQVIWMDFLGLFRFERSSRWNSVMRDCRWIFVVLNERGEEDEGEGIEWPPTGCQCIGMSIKESITISKTFELFHNKKWSDRTDNTTFNRIFQIETNE